MREPVVFLVLAVLRLQQRLGVAGNGGRVVRPVFLVDSPERLETEKVLDLFVADRHEQLRAPRRRDVPAEGMAVRGVELFETVERVVVLEDEEVRYGEYLRPAVRETFLQVRLQPGCARDLVKKVCRPEKEPPRFLRWNRPRPGRDFFRLARGILAGLHLFLHASVGRDDAARFLVEPPDKRALGPGHLFLLVPPRLVFVGVGDA